MQWVKAYINSFVFHTLAVFLPFLPHVPEWNAMWRSLATTAVSKPLLQSFKSFMAHTNYMELRYVLIRLNDWGMLRTPSLLFHIFWCLSWTVWRPYPNHHTPAMYLVYYSGEPKRDCDGTVVGEILWAASECTGSGYESGRTTPWAAIDNQGIPQWKHSCIISHRSDRGNRARQISWNRYHRRRSDTNRGFN